MTLKVTLEDENEKYGLQRNKAHNTGLSRDRNKAIKGLKFISADLEYFVIQKTVPQNCDWSGVPQYRENSGEGRSTSWLPMLCNPSLAVRFRGHYSTKTLNNQNFKLKLLKLAQLFRGRVQLTELICHPEPMEDALVPLGQDGRGKTERWVAWFHSIWNSPPVMQDQPQRITWGDTRRGLYFSLRNCKCSCRNHYWRIFQRIRSLHRKMGRTIQRKLRKHPKRTMCTVGVSWKGLPLSKMRQKKNWGKYSPKQKGEKKRPGEKQWKFWRWKINLNR